MTNDDESIIDVGAEELVNTSCIPAIYDASTARSIDSRPTPPQWSEDWWQQARPEVQARRCVGHKRNGVRCLKIAINGATVCRTHGGATRHVRNAARIRLENAAELMAKQLVGLAITAESESVRLAAIRDALDRAGLKPPSEVVLAQDKPKPYVTVFESIGGSPPGEQGDININRPPAQPNLPFPSQSPNLPTPRI